jgi:hypothetical protein
MGPAEAVKAHIDLETPFSIAAHYQVFRLGVEGFDDAVNVLVASLKEHNLKPDAFATPALGQAIKIPPMLDASLLPAGNADYVDLPLGFTGAARSNLLIPCNSLEGNHTPSSLRGTRALACPSGYQGRGEGEGDKVFIPQIPRSLLRGGSLSPEAIVQY